MFIFIVVEIDVTISLHWYKLPTISVTLIVVVTAFCRLFNLFCRDDDL